MKKANSNLYLGHGCMSLWALLVGTSFPLVSDLSPDLPMLLVTAIRFLVAFLILLPFLRPWNLPRPDIKSASLYLVMGACQAFFFASMLWAAPTTSSLLMSSLYVMVPLVAYFLGLKLRLAQAENGLLKILLLGSGGALLLAWGIPQDNNGQSLSGAWIYALGCFAVALHPVLSKWGLNRNLLSGSATARTLYSLFTGAALTLLAGIATEPVSLLRHIELQDIGIILYLGIFSTALTFWLTQVATENLLPAEVKSYSYLVPLVSLGVLLLLGETKGSWISLPGTAIVLLSTALLQVRSIRTYRQSGNVMHAEAGSLPADQQNVNFNPGSSA